MHAPSDLSQGELLLLVALAELARDETRECFPGMPTICWRTRMTENGVSAALKRLRDRGIEIRKQLGTTSRGKAIFAHEGTATTYRIPDFKAFSGRARTPPPGWERPYVGTPSDDKRPCVDMAEAVPRHGRGRAPAPPYPSLSPQEPYPAEGAAQMHDAIDSTAARELREHDKTPTHPPRQRTSPSSKSRRNRCPNNAIVAADGSCCGRGCERAAAAS